LEVKLQLWEESIDVIVTKAIKYLIDNKILVINNACEIISELLLEKIRDELLNLVENEKVDYKTYSNLMGKIFLSDSSLKQSEMKETITLSVSLEPKYYNPKL